MYISCSVCLSPILLSTADNEYCDQCAQDKAKYEEDIPIFDDEEYE